jgi:hypothetical protein
MAVSARLDDAGLHVVVDGAAVLWSFARRLELSWSEIEAVERTDWSGVRERLGMGPLTIKVAGTSLPGGLAGGWFLIRRPRRGVGWFWVQRRRRDEVMLFVTRSARPVAVAVSASLVDTSAAPSPYPVVGDSRPQASEAATASPQRRPE